MELTDKKNRKAKSSWNVELTGFQKRGMPCSLSLWAKPLPKSSVISSIQRTTLQHILPPRRIEANEQNLKLSNEYGLDRREPITDEYVIDFECKFLLCKFQRAKVKGKTRQKKHVFNAFLVDVFQIWSVHQIEVPRKEKNNEKKVNLQKRWTPATSNRHWVSTFDSNPLCHRDWGH